jgi:hypothetical protein
MSRRADTLAQAVAIRDVALRLIRNGGARDGRLAVWKQHEDHKRGLCASLHTPFGGIVFPKLEPDVQRIEVDGLRLLSVKTVSDTEANQPWGLSVWSDGRKVLNIEWNERPARVALITFRRGDWEQELFAVALSPVD